ncbi:hypothetical protein BH20ACI4_BH20ACI4_27310 [soil metagenome]
MKIRKLQLKNIGVFDDETIEFQKCPEGKAEIHIFTGQNGTGKTTLLMSLASGFGDLGLDDKQIGSEEDYLRFDNLFPQFNNNFEKRFQPFDENLIKICFDKDLLPVVIDGFDRDSYSVELPYPIYLHSISTAKRHYFNFRFAVFSFSGYRHIQGERIEALYEPRDFNPLSQSLDFIKDYSQENQITINQLIANNISKSAIEKGRNKEKSERFAKVLSSIEQIIAEITGWKIEFDMQTEPINLVTKVNGEELEFDVLPDGLRSLISWIADLLGRVDLLKWNDDLPIFEKNLILFLDEIEVHLHPAWQRKVLPVVQNLFKNSQIFVSTHSPFVVNSIDDAWVYELKVENGKAKVAEKSLTKTAYSYQTVLREIFDIDDRFGEETQKELDKFYLKSKAVLESNGNGKVSKKKLLEAAKQLASQSAELQSLVFLELARLSNETGETYEI